MGEIETEEKNEASLLRIIQGLCLVIASNLIYVANNYIVSWAELSAPEVGFVRGCFQVTIFASLVYKNRKEVKATDWGKSGKMALLLLLCSMYGFMDSTMGFSCLSAIPLMPIGDLIVISFSSPVFSVFLDRIFLKRPLSALLILLCVFVIVGDVLVVQPPFIFRANATDGGHINGSSTMLENHSGVAREDLKDHGTLYYFGVALCLYAALACAIESVICVHVSKKGVPLSVLMLASGIFGMVVSSVSTLFMSNRLLTDPGSLPLKAALLLPVSGILDFDFENFLFSLCCRYYNNDSILHSHTVNYANEKSYSHCHGTINRNSDQLGDRVIVVGKNTFNDFNDRSSNSYCLCHCHGCP